MWFEGLIVFEYKIHEEAVQMYAIHFVFYSIYVENLS